MESKYKEFIKHWNNLKVIDQVRFIDEFIGTTASHEILDNDDWDDSNGDDSWIT